METTTLYHASPKTCQEAILENGLKAAFPDNDEMEMPFGVYMTKSPLVAYNTVRIFHEKVDVYEIDVTGLDLARDPWDVLEEADNNFYTANDLPANRIKLFTENPG